ncbi:MAG: tRNA (adenosine(37)-N6)-threonylcarbamoyltransferase complex ATPase subunit type 1 TsaE [Arcobacter butzleri]|nr:tRNA (adenosine(37)-N6)-threonylcarbamoyltransferase complex ATPase subunit type 1 TsaE [Arcobacteraceae bacterium]MDY0365781.1 tRNA (adenosine(37)-N6)-threonylcarbamoyltransferase complex ATPase subunit type 1 TsaE [Arcobacteraceae bacterium]NLO17663.1 tRNA (adenosine(37)-N6)-threonylcarbamoyltransferase complex ATPase subunit type 1 TsaE [Aliarcobacter butzleri]
MNYSFVVGLNDIQKVVSYLKEQISNKDYVILLRGDLASGKTTLVKEFVNSLDIKESVTSPTFSIQSLYGDNIYHYDVYNKSLNEFISLGLLEEFEKQGIHFVEWGDEKLEDILYSYGFRLLIVTINKLENKREYLINE